MDFLDYFTQAESNLMVMSRTANRNLDLSTSPYKKERMAEGLDPNYAAALVKRNFSRVCIYTYHFRNMLVSCSDCIRSLIDNIAYIMNQELVKKDYLYRLDDSIKYPYTLVQDLTQSRHDFYERFFSILKEGKDPIYLAAFVEWHIDIRDHFFVDSCGKIARAVSSWVLMRANLPLPDLTFQGFYHREESKQRYYSYTPNYRRLENLVQDDLDFYDFYKYYTSLIKRP